ncbi:unnamed protein product [Schistosoma curassoni]|uniref:Eukaryotic translation initiation factor 2 subunit 1 n=1 Tax=Schistosoma curassoni TaxID=6186 RepID=A0A183L4K6_9TREM|nr:unnamed protein product [Schistosoma curassoni]
MPIQCRFYEDLFPEVGDVVLVTVKVIQSMGSYVELLEYKNIGGMILHSELSRRRIRSISKLVRIGSNTEVTVVRVDSAKGYIDLSKRRASAEEIAKCKERFAKAKAVNQILRNVAEKLDYKTDEQLEELCRKTAWYFDRKTGRRADSPMVLDRIMKTSKYQDKHGMQWTAWMQLDDLDFVDDLVLLSRTQQEIQINIANIAAAAFTTVCPNMYDGKSKFLKYITVSINRITLGGEASEGVGAFSHLGSII